MAGSSKKSLTSAPMGQGYLATVSDLISALLFVFIILLAVFAYQLTNAASELASAGAQRNRMLDEISSRLEDAGIVVEVLYDQGILRLSNNAVNFPSGSEIPVQEHHANVGLLAGALAEVVPCYVSAHRTHTHPANVPREQDNALTIDYCRPAEHRETPDCRPSPAAWRLETLLIEGHTDAVPVGSGRRFLDNLELSSMRAATVHRMIADCEPNIAGLLNSEHYPVLSTSGYGHTRPATLDPALDSKNRRIDLRFLLEPPKTSLDAQGPAIQSDLHERLERDRP